VKTPEDSLTVIEEVVLPNDTNPLGILRGGTMMHWMDIASAICAQKHSDLVAVTVSVDKFVFKNPIHLGDIVKIIARITRVFSTSMEIKVQCWLRNKITKEEILTNQAYFTFVALDENHQPVAVPALKIQTTDEKQQHKRALKRKKERLK
jgi:acyl-CoA hydrolase